MNDKKSVVLGKTAYETIAGKRYRSDDPTYSRALDVLNSVFSEGVMYPVRDGEYHLYLNRLEGAFVLRSDRFTDADFFTVTFKRWYVPPRRGKSEEVDIEWKNM